MSTPCPSLDHFFGFYSDKERQHVEQMLTELMALGEHILSDLFTKLDSERPFKSPQEAEHNRRRAQIEEAQQALDRFASLVRLRFKR